MGMVSGFDSRIAESMATSFNDVLLAVKMNIHLADVLFSKVVKNQVYRHFDEKDRPIEMADMVDQLKAWPLWVTSHSVVIKTSDLPATLEAIERTDRQKLLIDLVVRLLSDIAETIADKTSVSLLGPVSTKILDVGSGCHKFTVSLHWRRTVGH